MVSKGKVYNQIIDVSKMISTDLIVMGTTGSPKEGFKRFIGSNAERVVRLAQCPVITIKGQNLRNGCQNIILPLDLEKETREKITYAIEYARYWDATIRLVSVLLDDNQHNKNVLIKNINQAERFIKDAGVSCSAELVSGDKKVTLGDFVFNYAKENDGDLIMIMTKKEELSLSQNISVTARYIINNSEIPVMSIRPKSKTTRINQVFHLIMHLLHNLLLKNSSTLAVAESLHLDFCHLKFLLFQEVLTILKVD